MGKTSKFEGQLEEYRAEIRKLYMLLGINAMISSALDQEKVLDTIMKKAVELMDAEAGSVLLIDEKTGEFYFQVPQGEKSEEVKTIRLPKGEGIAGWVAQNGQPLLVPDVKKDPRHYKKVDKKTKFQTRSVLCVPLEIKDKVIGVIEVLNKRSGNFTDEDMVILNILAYQASIAIDNARLHRKVSELMERSDRQLSAIEEVGGLISSITNLRRLLVLLIQLALDLVDADVGSIILPGSSALTSQVNYGLEESVVRSIRFKDGREVLEKVIETGDAEVIEDIEDDDRFEPFKGDVIIRSFLCIPLKTYEKTIGVLNIVNVDEDFFREDILNLLFIITNLAAITIENARLHGETARQAEELALALEGLKEAYNTTLAALSAALDARDRETEGHSRRVTDYTLAMARALGLPEEELEDIRRGALLHDIGKIGISDTILHKPGELTPEEWAEMERHPEIAFEMLRSIRFLERSLIIPLYHHEQWDGTGYLYGLEGEKIPLAARIFAVADAYDAMTSDRPYRAAISHEEALAELRRRSGRQFDPKVVAVFLSSVSPSSKNGSP